MIDLLDRTCVSCGVTFKFPSHLKQHLNSASHALYEANLRQLDQEEGVQPHDECLTEMVFEECESIYGESDAESDCVIEDYSDFEADHNSLTTNCCIIPVENELECDAGTVYTRTSIMANLLEVLIGASKYLPCKFCISLDINIQHLNSHYIIMYIDIVYC